MYTIIYYKTRRGAVPAREFVEKLTVKVQSKIRKQILLLSYEGPKLKRPYADYLRDGIYELRVKFSPNEYRVLYFFFLRTNIILTHGFVKKSDKVPESEIEKAIKYKLEFKERYKR
jgi:phage-related protein